MPSKKLPFVVGKKRGGTPLRKLIDALMAHDVEKLRAAIQDGADPNAEDKDGYTPLALSYGSLETTSALLDAGADPNQPFDRGRETPLIRAIHASDELLALLLRRGADPNAAVSGGRSPLMEAIKRNSPKAVARLLAHGADPNAADDGGTSPLGHAERSLAAMTDAAEDSSTPDPVDEKYKALAAEVVKILKEHGARNDAALDLALERAAGRGDLDAVRELLGRGANADACTDDESVLTSAAHRGHAEVVRVLLAAGATPDRQRDDGMTALERAAMRGHYEVALTLLGAGADPKRGETSAIAIARGNRHGELAKLLGTPTKAKKILAEIAAARNPVDDALRAAVGRGDVSGVQAALAAGASPNAGDGPRSVLEVAFNDRKNTDPIATALIEAGADVKGVRPHLLWAVERSPAILEKFLAAGADPNASAFIGNALSVAARGGHEAAIKLLLAAGADPNAGCPLGDAIIERRAGCARLLLDGGADLDIAYRALALLPTAAALGDLTIVELLLDRGDAVDRREATPSDPMAALGLSIRRTRARVVVPRGATALIAAARAGHAAIVERLLRAGADKDAVDESGTSALGAALAEEHRDVITLLEATGARALRGAPPKAAPSPTLRFLSAFEPREVEEEEDEGSEDAVDDERAGDEDEDEDEDSEDSEDSAHGHELARVRGAGIDVSRYEQDMVLERLRHSAARAREAEVIARLTDVSGSKPLQVEELSGVTAHVREGKTVDIPALQDVLRPLGWTALLEHRGPILALPTIDPLDALSALATNGANYDVMPDDIIAWLSLTHETQPHRIIGASFDSVTLRFDGHLTDGATFLRGAVDFCPDLLDDVADEAALGKMVDILNERRELFLWWD